MKALLTSNIFFKIKLLAPKGLNLELSQGWRVMHAGGAVLSIAIESKLSDVTLELHLLLFSHRAYRRNSEVRAILCLRQCARMHSRFESHTPNVSIFESHTPDAPQIASLAAKLAI